MTLVNGKVFKTTEWHSVFKILKNRLYKHKLKNDLDAWRVYESGHLFVGAKLKNNQNPMLERPIEQAHRHLHTEWNTEESVLSGGLSFYTRVKFE